MKKKTKKRKKLGEGFIWFIGNGAEGYTGVSLYEGYSATGRKLPFKLHDLGAWQKVCLYAEYEERKR